MNNKYGKTAIPGAGLGVHGQLKESSHHRAGLKTSFSLLLPISQLFRAGNDALRAGAQGGEAEEPQSPEQTHIPWLLAQHSQRGRVGAEAETAPELSPVLHSCR